MSNVCPEPSAFISMMLEPFWSATKMMCPRCGAAVGVAGGTGVAVAVGNCVGGMDVGVSEGATTRVGVSDGREVGGTTVGGGIGSISAGGGVEGEGEGFRVGDAIGVSVISGGATRVAMPTVVCVPPTGGKIMGRL